MTIAVCSLQSADFRLQTSDGRLQTSDCRYQTADCRLQTAYSGPQNVDYYEDWRPQILKTAEFNPTKTPVVLKLRLFDHVKDDMGIC